MAVFHRARGSHRGAGPRWEELLMTPLQVKFTRRRVVIDLSWTTAIKTLLCFGLGIAADLLPVPGLEDPGPRICFVIFVSAAALWVTELIPAYATAIMVIVASVYLLGQPDGPLQLDRTGAHSWEIFVNPVASPVLVLFFGGFVLARGATKHGFDVRLARAFITPFGTRPSMLLLGIILTTALFSMFMSNTATTAMMIAIVSPLFANLGGRDQFKRMIVLAVPFAANIGGMGTIIGTPPNAVAASVLQKMGSDYEISFLGWMMVGVPVVTVMLIALWVILLVTFRPKREPLQIHFPEVLEITPGLAIVVATFVVTVLMWLTQPLHGIPSAVVAMLPVAVFTAFSIIDRNDLKSLDWDVMILVAGGMTLGVAMRESGLSEILVGLVPFDVLPSALVIAVIALVAITFSNFMSNTSTANLLIPIVTALGVTIDPRTGALLVALTASLAMSLPISTPPNAIAFATRAVSTREMAAYGTLVSAVGLALLLTLFLTLGGLLTRL
jgi:sodium-dependent dicarboxylate transporter 2/3/5